MHVLCLSLHRCFLLTFDQRTHTLHAVNMCLATFGGNCLDLPWSAYVASLAYFAMFEELFESQTFYSFDRPLGLLCRGLFRHFFGGFPAPEFWPVCVLGTRWINVFQRAPKNKNNSQTHKTRTAWPIPIKCIPSFRVLASKAGVRTSNTIYSHWHIFLLFGHNSEPRSCCDKILLLDLSYKSPGAFKTCQDP